MGVDAGHKILPLPCVGRSKMYLTDMSVRGDNVSDYNRTLTEHFVITPGTFLGDR